MSIPERRPDLHEVLTLSQLHEAVLDWLSKHRKCDLSGDWAASVIAVDQKSPTDGAYHLKMWRRQ